MSLFAILKEKRAERKKLHDENNKVIIDAAKDKRAMSKEEETEFDKRDAAAGEIDKEIERLEKQHERDVMLNQTPTDTRQAGRENFDPSKDQARELTADQKKQRSVAQRTWMLGGDGRLTDEQRSLLSFSAAVPADASAEVRALSAISGALGAYTIPQGFSGTIDVALLTYGGMLNEADIITTEQGNDFPYPSINDTANQGEVIGENVGVGGSDATPSGEQDPAYGVTMFHAYTVDSTIVRVPVTLIQDQAFDLEKYFANDLLRIRLGRKINGLTTNGTGANQPTGIVPASPTGVTTASNAAFTYNELLTLFHSVDPLYRSDAKWMFADSTLLAVKKLVDSNARPLFIAGGVSEGIQNDAPDTMMGKPYSINQDMPAIAPLVSPIIFGNLKKYKIRKVRDYQMVRFGERFMDKLQIGFLVWTRIDGNLVDAGTHPVKKLTMHA